MNVSLKSLVGKLNDTCRSALEGAAGLCLTRTHYDVDVEHLFVKLCEMPDTDLQRVLRQYEVDQARLLRDLTRALDRLKTGNARTPALSPRIPRLVTEAWTVASIGFGAPRIRSGHLLLALLANDDLARLARESSPEFQKISPEDLQARLPDLVAGSGEDKDEARLGPAEAAEGRPVGTGKTPALDQYTIDLTTRARQGEIDPVLGRDFEIRQMVDILTRRRQNNPILTGEAGVGKTAVVEGLALRIAAGDVPPPLKNVSLRVLDLALLQAGGRGEGGVREPPQVGDRGGEGLAATGDPVHRRGAHDDRGRGAGRAGGCRQPPEARAGPRRAAHHRRHHLVRVQEVFRKGCGPGPPLPGHQGGGAHGGAGRGDDAGVGGHAGEPPQRPHPG
jgi:type VI secretion system protein VasG